jgi:Tfp pilus assembly protein PilF
MKVRSPVIIMFLSFVFLGLPAWGDDSRAQVVNRELSQAILAGYLKQHDYDSAESYLKQHLSEDPTDARAWNTLGLAFLEQNKYGEAHDMFRKAASFATGDDKAVYLYNAADAASRAGQAEKSQEALNQAQEAATPLLGIGDQIERTRNVFKAGEPLPSLSLVEGSSEAQSAQRLTAWVALKSGYDSNVTLLPDEANRSPEPASALIAPTVFVEYGAPLWNGSFAARTLTTYTDYTAANASPYSNLFESVAAEWSPKTSMGGQLTTTFGDRYDFSFADTSGFAFFSWTDTVYANAIYRIDEASSFSAELPMGYQGFPGVPLVTGSDNRDGLLLTPTVLYRRKVSDFTLSGGGTYQNVFAIGDEYKSHSYGLLAGAARALPWSINGRLGLGYLWTYYPDSIEDRRDQNLNVSLNLSRAMPFDKRITVGIDYIFIDNFSNLDTASYHQHVATLQVSYAIH